MRMIFGVLSLLIVVAVVGVLAKKQLAVAPAPVSAMPGAGAPQQQVEQVRQAVQDAMQQSRPMPEDK